ncbi:hypothetical protein ACET3Z_013363 [Daucus carota]
MQTDIPFATSTEDRAAVGRYFIVICPTLEKLIIDVNVAVVVQAIQAIGNLARELRTNFCENSKYVLPVRLEKSREKRTILTDALTQTLQAMYRSKCFNLADIVEDNKIAVKIKPYGKECLNHGTPDVRDAAFSGLAAVVN